MKIRKARPSDADEASAVLRRSIEELCHADHAGDPARIAAWSANKTPEAWLAWVDQPTTSLFVATVGGRVAGVGMMSHAGEIMLNYVAPGHRFAGISKALLGHMEAEAVALGLARCTLKSTSTAERFYRAAGYRPDEHADDMAQLVKDLGR